MIWICEGQDYSLSPFPCEEYQQLFSSIKCKVNPNQILITCLPLLCSSFSSFIIFLFFNSLSLSLPCFYLFTGVFMGMRSFPVQYFGLDRPVQPFVGFLGPTSMIRTIHILEFVVNFYSVKN